MSLVYTGRVLLILAVAACALASGTDYPVVPVPFTAVKFEDPFWRPRLDTNRAVTIPYCFRRCEETGRIDNFAKAGKLMPGEFTGIYYNDSDVFKVVEGASYALAQTPDPNLDAYLDNLIVKIAAAQEPDGYLYTARTLNPDNPPKASGPARWSNLAHSHELYNLGHLYEAAVAHHQATGKRTLLDVALKSAELVLKEFGPQARHDPPGHQEIEIGLVKLYRLTQDRRYLDLARFFLDQRGRADGRELYGEYSQDHVPVAKQDRPVGHAVRALYMYSGMADVAALSGADDYRKALERLWQQVVSRQLYITGGLGARAAGESFGADYELPSASAYCETCAAIANVLWNQRMFLLHADGKYVDVLERSLYNGLLAGVGMSGDKFFYVNPLLSYGGIQRQPWFECACCPTNIARFLPSLPGYVYAVRGDELFVNLFIGGTARIPIAGQTVTVQQTTTYPWDGRVNLRIEPERPAEFTLQLRVPGWAVEEPVPSDLYRYNEKFTVPHTLVVGDAQGQEKLDIQRNNGYTPVRRKWQSGDWVSYELLMPTRRVNAHRELKENAERVALERGPLVFCVEGLDHEGHVHNLTLPENLNFGVELRPELLGGVRVVRSQAHALYVGADGRSIEGKVLELLAVPYFAWGHRDDGEMLVWIARVPRAVRPVPQPTLAVRGRPSASHVGGSLRALHDQLETGSSADRETPRFTWGERRGTTEWVQYDFEKAARVFRTGVYWCDDAGGGPCRVPAQWRILYRKEQAWEPVTGATICGILSNEFNFVQFDAVETTGLRLEVQLQEGFAAGLFEWKVE
jgi:DUF1680 family protein